MAIYLVKDNPRADDLREIHRRLVDLVGDKFTLHNHCDTVMLFIAGGCSAVHGYFPDWPGVDAVCEAMAAGWVEHLLTGEEAKCGKALRHNNE